MYLILTASPNKEGLTAACGKAMVDGITGAGGECEVVDISQAKLQPCLICNDGWGTCFANATCVIQDELQSLQEKFKQAEGIVLVTPVYWGEPSERMKFFLDRFRRCEAFHRGGSAAGGKQIDLIAAAGGSGNGTVTALAEMENWCRHVGATARERIGVTRFNREPMLAMIRDAGARFVTGNYFKGF
ncbi:MAG: flavodoxin family protein [Lachnospiraceae bacterium]|nr:flavodoxin family protein [Lachnospiraceae bacterium]